MPAKQAKPAKPANDGLLSFAQVAGLTAQIGFAVAAVAILATYGGHQLDQHLATGPAFLLVGIVLGFAVSMALVWRLTHHLRRQ